MFNVTLFFFQSLSSLNKVTNDMQKYVAYNIFIMKYSQYFNVHGAWTIS